VDPGAGQGSGFAPSEGFAQSACGERELAAIPGPSHGDGGLLPAIKLHQVRCVVAAARQGSFRRAAAVLNIRQSSVSRCVRDLEDHLGAPIFERRASGVRLTAAGGQFLEGAEQALEHLGRAAGTAAAAGRDERRILRIGAAPLPGSRIVPTLLERLNGWRSPPQLRIHEASSAENLRDLRAGRVDLAVVLGRPQAPGLVVTPLHAEWLVVVGAPPAPARQDGAVRWADLRASTLVLPPGELGALIADRLAEAPGGPWQGAFSVAGTETALRLAALGQGVALMTESAVDATAPALVRRAIFDDALLVSAVSLARNEKPALRRFLALARAMAAERDPGCVVASAGAGVLAKM
jgi:DNA-binding transcriptional LysR family regulator